MKILFDLNHAAHVHFIKHTYKALQKQGAELKVIATDKPLAYQLLDQCDIAYTPIGSYGKSLLSKFWKLFLLNFRMFFILMQFKPDLIVGIVAIRGAQVGWLLRMKSLVFTDTAHARLQIALFRPFATQIYTPKWFSRNLGRKQIRYLGFHELAYLHPNHFVPDPNIFHKLGLQQDEAFFILRFLAWDATHDINQHGFSAKGKKELITFLQTHGKVFITAEYKLEEEYASLVFPLDAQYMHDALCYAQMYIGEGATMSTEAAILGTPSILVNTISLANMHYLEQEYDLLRAFRSEKKALSAIKEIIKNPNLKLAWSIKRDRFLQDHLDTTKFLLNEIKDVCQKNNSK